MRVEAPSQAALFEGALRGMAGLLKEGFCEGTDALPRECHFALTAPDTTCLLIDFLSEVLTRTYTEKAVFCKAVFNSLSEDRMDVHVYGQEAGGLDEEIKAVTYHGAHISRNKGNHWVTSIIFDI